MALTTKARQNTIASINGENEARANPPGFIVPSVRMPAKVPQEEKKECPVLQDKPVFVFQLDKSLPKKEFSDLGLSTFRQEAEKCGLAFNEKDLLAHWQGGSLTDSKGNHYWAASENDAGSRHFSLHKINTIEDFNKFASANSYTIVFVSVPASEQSLDAENTINKIRHSSLLADKGVGFATARYSTDLANFIETNYGIKPGEVCIVAQDGKLISKPFQLNEWVDLFDFEIPNWGASATNPTTREIIGYLKIGLEKNGILQNVDYRTALEIARMRPGETLNLALEGRHYLLGRYGDRLNIYETGAGRILRLLDAHENGDSNPMLAPPPPSQKGKQK